MLGCSRITNLILTIAVSFVLTVMIAASIIAYSVTEVISDRDTVKEAIKDEKVKEEFLLYIQEELDKQTDGDISLILDDEAVATLLEDQATSEKVDETLDALVDDTYNWLEGEGDQPTITIGEANEEDETLLEEEIRDKLGPVGDLINYDELNEASSQFRLYEIKDEQVDKIPHIYNTLTDLYKKILIGVIVLALLLIFSAQSLRKGAFYLGIILVAAGVLVLFSPAYIRQSPEAQETIEARVEELPWVIRTLLKESIQTIEDVDPPQFVNEFGIVLFQQIQNKASLYAKITIALGIVLAVGTQLSIRRTEAELDYDDMSNGSPRDEERMASRGYIGDEKRRIRTITDDFYDDNDQLDDGPDLESEEMLEMEE